MNSLWGISYWSDRKQLVLFREFISYFCDLINTIILFYFYYFRLRKILLDFTSIKMSENYVCSPAIRSYCYNYLITPSFYLQVGSVTWWFICFVHKTHKNKVKILTIDRKSFEFDQNLKGKQMHGLLLLLNIYIYTYIRISCLSIKHKTKTKYVTKLHRSEQNYNGY